MISVLIVDDGRVMQEMLSEILSADEEIEVIGIASDAYEARDMMVLKRPDVVCLDVNMPRMDGITFLRKMMLYMPTPTVMVSSLTTEGAKETLMALEAGAVSFVAKPQSSTSLEEFGQKLVEEVKTAAGIAIEKMLPASSGTCPVEFRASDIQKDWIIAIGASTGGTKAIAEILKQMPAESPGIVIVQHIPRLFTAAFAESLNRVSRLDVKEAEEGDEVVPGRVLIAPGGMHMRLKRYDNRVVIRLDAGEKVSGHRPSVNVLFDSLCALGGFRKMAILLTGMGRDGAKGMLNLYKKQAVTIAQDEATSVVYGMPHAACRLGGVAKVCALGDIPKCIFRYISSESL